MYRVICFFTDLHDANHPYHVGDIFPRDGTTVTEDRLLELAGSNNRQGKPLIQEELPGEEVKEVAKPEKIEEKPKKATRKRASKK